jgi:hypothetical protein
LHFVAVSAFASLQKGHSFVGAAGSSRMNHIERRYTTSMRITKEISALMKRP